MSVKAFPRNVRYGRVGKERSNVSKNALRVGDLPCDLISIPRSFVHSGSKATPRKRCGTRIK